MKRDIIATVFALLFAVFGLIAVVKFAWYPIIKDIIYQIRREWSKKKPNIETRTTVTVGYPEAGPFETKDEAMRAFVQPLGFFVLSVEHRDDGWYRTYIVSSTSSIYEDTHV